MARKIKKRDGRTNLLSSAPADSTAITQASGLAGSHLRGLFTETGFELRFCLDRFETFSTCSACYSGFGFCHKVGYSFQLALAGRYDSDLHHVTITAMKKA